MKVVASVEGMFTVFVGDTSYEVERTYDTAPQHEVFYYFPDYTLGEVLEKELEVAKMYYDFFYNEYDGD